MQDFKLYNTLTRREDILKPQVGKTIDFYSCGPTVYSDLTIGNWRTYVMTDILKKYLEYSDYKVKHTLNITDVGHLTGDVDIDAEDKILAAAGKQKMTPLELAEFFEKKFHEGEKSLNIKPATNYPRATENIDKMIKVIETLIEKGFAYESEGNVYFDVSKSTDYGKLSGNTLDKLKEAVRPEIKLRTDKRTFADFALWIKAPKNHALKWDSPWSVGYPGWHVECSAMAGTTVDIHSGGEDNIFPHHEDEIAQSEAASGEKPFAKQWFHVRHLLIDGKRMGKSVGNVISLEQIKNKRFNPLDLRMLFLQTHYRSKQNFTWKALEQARSARAQFMNIINSIEQAQPKKKFWSNYRSEIARVRNQFTEALNTDLNTAQALAIIFDWLKDLKQQIGNNLLSEKELQQIKDYFYEIDNILGILGDLSSDEYKLNSKQTDLIDQRNQARNKKDFEKSDEIRDILAKDGILLEDTSSGTIWRRK